MNPYSKAEQGQTGFRIPFHIYDALPDLRSTLIHDPLTIYGNTDGY